MATPVFRGGVHIGYFACTAHVVDVGGRGFGPDAGEVYEEGLLIPISKFAERGVINDFLITMVRANVRTPDQTVGDMYSLAACNEAGNRRLQAMLDEFGLADIDGLSDYIIDASRAATRAAIRNVPDGIYDNTMQVDGYDKPVTMKVRIDVKDDRLTADFAGTSGMSARGVNVPEVYTRAYAGYALKCTIAAEVPNNTGSLDPFEITAPEGSILAAKRPAPVSVRHVIGHLVPDVVLGALHKALPETVPAEGASALWNIQISARPLDAASNLPSAEILMFNSGGTGARPGLDGLSATAFPSGVSTMSVEATEHVGPITVWRKELRAGSGGAGAQRGGFGLDYEIELRRGTALASFVMDHGRTGPLGALGGDDGAPNAVEVWRNGACEVPEHLSKAQDIPLVAGDRVRVRTPGGGGYGDPMARDPDAVAKDVALERYSGEDAERLFGVVVKDGTVDLEATRALRSRKT
jgi:N-methylhydantoinase B